ncbi:MAG: ATP-binding protein [Pseudomonadota bacterium]
MVTATGPISNPIEFEIEVMAVWWRRQEAYLLYLWIPIILASLIFFRRARTIEIRYKLIADERKRIAQDLHDTSLQDILGAKVFGQALVDSQSDVENQQLAERVVGLLDTATRSVRKSVSEFSEMAEVRELSETIKGCEAPAKYGQDIPVQVNEHGAQWDMTPQRRFFLSRIVQEAINNACKHARPSTIWIDMHWSWKRLQISVVDDGTGFDPESETFKQGFGLGAMQRMAKAAKSTITLNSSESKGTEVLLSVPRFYL